MKTMQYFIRIIDYLIGYGNGSSSEFLGLKRYLVKNINKNSIMIDVGANIGDFTDFYGRHVKNFAKIYMIEPNLELFEGLSTNDKKSKMQFAIGDLETDFIELKIPTDKKWNGISRIGEFVEEKFKDLAYDVYKIPCKKLDDIILQEELRFVDFIKIDTEGHDLSVIKSMSNALKNNKIGHVYFEFGPANIGTKVFFIDIVRFLDSLNINYSIYKFGLFGIKLKVSYSIWNEYFRGNTNYLICFNN